MVRAVLRRCFGIGLYLVLPFTFASAAEEPSNELIQQIVRLIGDQDREFRAAALEQLRTSAKGSAATELFAAQIPKLNPEGQVALLRALADRGDATALPAVLALIASSNDADVRVAAVAAIGQLGSTNEIPLLIKALSSGAGGEQQAARQSLARLSGDQVSKILAAEVRSASAPLKAQLIEILAARRASDEVAALIEASVDENAQVRRVAMNALGQLGRPEQIAAVLPSVLKAGLGDERDNAERNVALICARIANDDERGSRLIEALDKVPATDRDKLLSLVGRVGGQKLIQFVVAITASPDAARRRLGIDALSNWPDSSVADELLKIASNTTDADERNQAFQGYVRVSSIRDNRNDRERLERMKQAMKVARTAEEQTIVIGRTRTAYDVESLRFVLPYVEQPQFAPIACETIVEIAHHREVRDPNKAEFDKALDKVIKTAKDPVVIDRAQRYKRGETWERPRRR